MFFLPLTIGDVDRKTERMKKEEARKEKSRDGRMGKEMSL